MPRKNGKRKQSPNEPVSYDRHRLLRMRCDNRSSSKASTEANEIKTSALIRGSRIRQNGSPSKQKYLEKKLSEAFTSIPTSVPATRITKRSDTGIPLEIEADNTILSLQDSDGMLFLFSNQEVKASPKKISKFDKPETFLNSSPAKNVKEKEETSEPIKILITPELLQKSAEEIKKNGGQRIKSQNQVMKEEGVAPTKASATTYARATGAFSDELLWEWVHFIAHKFLAGRAQDKKNLGCGSMHFNSQMMFAEYQIPHIAESYPEGFDLEVKPTYIEGIRGSHILKTADFIITTRDFSVCFTYDAQKSKKPDFLNFHYTSELTRTLIETSLKPPCTPEKKLSLDDGILFFTPSKTVSKEEEHENIDPPKIRRSSRKIFPLN